MTKMKCASFFFFFSSRRRHTRWNCDWSSDVCSSDLSFTRGTFRVRGDTLEIFPVYEELAVRVEFFGDEIERLMTLHPITGEVITEDNEIYVFPATHYVAGPERMERAINGIEAELEEQVAVPQIGGMYEGDMSRKRNLVDHGFRLPSAMDNRPLRWEEFLDRIGQTIYLSATPGDYEIAKGGGIDNVVQQIIRPTGLIDPEVVVKQTKRS